MKRFLTAMLAFCMVFSLSGCGIVEKLLGDRNIPGNTMEQTQPVEQEPERPDEPVETVPQPVELTVGHVEGDVYTNSFFDLSFTLPDGWTYATDTELKIHNAMTQAPSQLDLVDYLETAENKLTVMVASNGLESVEIDITKTPEELRILGMESLLAAGKQYIEEDFADESGMELVSNEITEISLCGKTVQCLQYQVRETEFYFTTCGLMAFFRQGDYLATITVLAFGEDGIDPYIDSFAAADPASGLSAAAVTENTYSLSALPGTLQVPEGYHVYALDSGYTEEMCKKQGIEKSKMDMYLQVCGSDMIILPEDASFVSPEFTVNVRVKGEKNYGMKNLKDLTDAEFSAFKAEFLAGFSATGALGEDTAVYENDSAKYIVFDWTVLKPQRRYATILNGKMVYFYVEVSSGQVTAEQEALLRQIIDTLKV